MKGESVSQKGEYAGMETCSVQTTEFPGGERDSGRGQTDRTSLVDYFTTEVLRRSP